MGGGPLKLLLDTHILVWWLGDVGRLTTAQVDALEKTQHDGERIALASVSLWEIAKLADRGRIQLARPVDEVLDEIEQHAGLQVLPLTARVAIESTRLGNRVPSDPADQLIIASARIYGLRLVTGDERIRRSGIVPVV